MITAAFLSLGLNLTAVLPPSLHDVIEAQLPIWSEVTGNPAEPSVTREERIAVERTDGEECHIFLIDRKIRATVHREGESSWLTDVIWCDTMPGRCEDVWSRKDAEWRSDKSTANHTGYAVYRDSLMLNSVALTDHAPSGLTVGKKKWVKAICAGGLCFLADQDSSVASVAVDGSKVLWKDINRASASPDIGRAYRFLMLKGEELH